MTIRSTWKLALLALVALAIGVAAGCGGDDSSAEPAAPAEPAEEPADATAPAEPAAPANGGEIEGDVQIDGSSTVAPLSTLAAEEFQIANSGARITVGISGTGGGFERFCNGETDLSDASRPIEDDEVQACAEAGVEFVEFRVATDALTVVVNPENDWVECLTVEQLSTIWGPEAEGTVTSWADVDPSFPDVPLTLAGPGTDSGTFDYFTDVVNGEEGASRADYTASEDDNIIVQAVQGDTGGTGYFGFSYFVENPDALKAVEVDGGGGCVAPSVETALSGEYSPLARPLFVYANVESFARPVVREFMRFYLENEPALAEAALMVPLSDDQLAEAMAAFEAAAS
jgi:phosphate transport system substrate-binding protein